MQDTFEFTCSECGKKLIVPGALTVFSCVYCGARLSLFDTQELPDSRIATSDELAFALANCVISNPNIVTEILRESYYPCFQKYRAENRVAIEQLENAAKELSSEDTSALLFTCVDKMLNILDEARLQPSADFSSFDKKGPLDRQRTILAVFFIPMVQSLSLGISEELCELIHDKWNARYPSSPFHLGDVDDIFSGFNKKRCYITSSVCSFTGKPDDCAELTALRSFRDGFLSARSDGAELIKEYYRTAPFICLCAQLCDDTQHICELLLDEYIKPCCEDIRFGREKECMLRYIEMVQMLKKRYGC